MTKDFQQMSDFTSFQFSSPEKLGPRATAALPGLSRHFEMVLRMWCLLSLVPGHGVSGAVTGNCALKSYWA